MCDVAGLFCKILTLWVKGIPKIPPSRCVQAFWVIFQNWPMCERHEEDGKINYISHTNIVNVRLCFRSRFGLQPFAGNYSHDGWYAKSGWLCRCLESWEDEQHLLSRQCKVFGDIVERFSDLTTDENLVEFFSAVLTRRDQLDEETQGLWWWGLVTPLLELILFPEWDTPENFVSIWDNFIKYSTDVLIIDATCWRLTYLEVQIWLSETKEGSQK